MASLARIFFTVFLVIFFIANCQTQVNASDEILILKTESVNPGSFYYPIKRLWEKGRARLLFNMQSKVEFNESLLKTRLIELNYVVERKLLSEVQTSSERFAYQAGILTEELVKGSQDKKEEAFKKFDQFSKMLEKLRDNYPANSSFWMLVQHDINTLKILSDKLK